MSKDITYNEWNNWIDELRYQITKVTDTFETITMSLDGYTINFNEDKGWDVSYGTNRVNFYELDIAILAIVNEDKSVNKCHQCKKEAAWKIRDDTTAPIFACSSHLTDILDKVMGSAVMIEKLEK
jgi:D-lyxose ketol-isomerase